jgi:hypothetical protein
MFSDEKKENTNSAFETDAAGTTRAGTRPFLGTPCQRRLRAAHAAMYQLLRKVRSAAQKQQTACAVARLTATDQVDAAIAL